MSITIITVATLFLSHAAHIQKSFKNHRFSRFSQFANHISHHVIYSTKRPLTPKQGGIPTTSNNYPLDKNGYAIPILFDAINFGSNKAIPADSPTASPEDVMNNVLSAFCSNSSDITISQQEYTNNTGSPEKAMSVPALPPVSCAPTQQVAVSIPQNQPAPTETAVCKSFFSKVLKLLAFQGVWMFLYSRFPLFFPLSGKNKGKSYCTLSSSFAASRLASLLACA